MKILCVSDQKDPLVYSNSIKSRFKDVDIVLGAGDLPLEYYEFIVTSLNKPLLFVFGNHNLREIKLYRKEYQSESFIQNNFERESRSHGIIYAGRDVKYINGLIIAGLGGSIRYNNGYNQFTDAEMFLQILKLIPKLLWNRIVYGRYLDILLTHAPPWGIHDKKDRCHRGFKSFLWFMRKFKPKYLIHGHIHLYDRNCPRVTRYGDTKVINVYGHFTIDTEEDSG